MNLWIDDKSLLVDPVAGQHLENGLLEVIAYGSILGRHPVRAGKQEAVDKPSRVECQEIHICRFKRSMA